MIPPIKSKIDLSKIQARTKSIADASHEQIDVFDHKEMYNDRTERGSKVIEQPKVKTKKTFFLKKLNPKWETMKSPDEEEMIHLSQPDS